MLHLYPELVAMARVRSDRDIAQPEVIEARASAQLGERYARAITGRLAALARAMPGWDAGTLEAFVAAERALISAEARGWRNGDPPEGWDSGLRPEHSYHMPVSLLASGSPISSGCPRRSKE